MNLDTFNFGQLARVTNMHAIYFFLLTKSKYSSESVYSYVLKMINSNIKLLGLRSCVHTYKSVKNLPSCLMHLTGVVSISA